MEDRRRYVGYCVTSETARRPASMTSSVSDIATTSCSLLQLFHKIKDAKRPADNRKNKSRRRSPNDVILQSRDLPQQRDTGVHMWAETSPYSYVKGSMMAKNTIAVQTNEYDNFDWEACDDDLCGQDLDLEQDMPVISDLLQARYFTRALTDDLAPHTERDSGLGGREGSWRQDESSEQEVTDDCFTPDGTTGFSSSSSHFADDFDSKGTSPAAMTSHAQQPRTFRDELELRCHVTRAARVSEPRDTVICMTERLQNMTVACQAYSSASHDHYSGRRRQRRTLSDGSEASTDSPTSVHSAGDVRQLAEARDLTSVKQTMTSQELSASPTLGPASHRLVPRMGTRVDSGRALPLAGNYIISSASQQPAACQRGVSSKWQTEECDSDTYCVLVPLSSVTGVKSSDTSRLHTIPEDLLDSTDALTTQRPLQGKATAPLSPKQQLMLARRDHALRQSVTSECCKASGASTCSGSNSGSQHSTDSGLKELYTKHVGTMVTNEAHLAHTIALQQRMFLQQVSTPGQPVSNPGQLTAPNKSPRQQQQQQQQQQAPLNDDQAAAGRYVVKRRADGSRYITRKAAPGPPLARLRRKQLLEDRARRLTDERRAVATTTDDDEARSEVKVAVRDGRRVDLLRVQKHKPRRHQQQQQGEPGTDEPLPLPLPGSGKVCHLRPKAAALDDFTTLDEILVHGVKDTGRSRAASGGLLSVTTV